MRLTPINAVFGPGSTLFLVGPLVNLCVGLLVSARPDSLRVLVATRVLKISTTTKWKQSKCLAQGETARWTTAWCPADVETPKPTSAKQDEPCECRSTGDRADITDEWCHAAAL